MQKKKKRLKREIRSPEGERVPYSKPSCESSLDFSKSGATPFWATFGRLAPPSGKIWRYARQVRSRQGPGALLTGGHGVMCRVCSARAPRVGAGRALGVERRPLVVEATRTDRRGGSVALVGSTRALGRATVVDIVFIQLSSPRPARRPASSVLRAVVSLRVGHGGLPSRGGLRMRIHHEPRLLHYCYRGSWPRLPPSQREGTEIMKPS